MECEDVYGALSRNEWENVREFCKKHSKGPFLALTKRRQSVLQKALYSTLGDLVLQLLEDAQKRWPRRDFERKLVDDITTRGDTIIHVAATHDACIPAVKKIFEHTTQLLFYFNEKSESPIFNAVRYGQLKMFQFLNSEIIKAIPEEEDRLRLYQAYNESSEHQNYTTILHVAIYNEHFELALYIAITIPSLISERDHNQLTSLHLLAMNHSAFNTQNWECHKLLFPNPFPILSDRISHEDATHADLKNAADVEILLGYAREGKSEDAAVGSGATMVTHWWKKNKTAYRRYRAALLLGSFLVKEDTSWIDKLEYSPDSNSNKDDDYYYDDDPKDYFTYQINIVADNSAPETNHNRDLSIVGQDKKTEKPPTPLVLATKYGFSELALEILKKHPQTVEQTGAEGSVLHLAIRYRSKEIIDAVMNMKMQMRKLVRWKDHQGNSILHMVALNTPKAQIKKGTGATSTDKPKSKLLHPWDAEVPINESHSPAIELREDLLLFEYVEEILKTNYHKSPNNDLQTPDQLFVERKELLRQSAQEYMKRTAENCSLVAILIATVAFAAAYTVPGGTDDKNGYPLLLDQPFFVVFTIADVLSLAFTLSAIVTFLSIITSPFRFQDFKVTLPRSLMFGILCLILSLVMMILAFAATIILMVQNKKQWTKIALYSVAFLPATMLIVLYMTFYVPLAITIKSTMDKLKYVLPKFDSAKSCTSITKKHTPSPQLQQGRQCSDSFAV